MKNNTVNKPKWIKELVNIIIGGSLIGLFSLFFLPPVAIKYWWLIWLISSAGILLWRLLRKSKNSTQKKRVGLDTESDSRH